MTTLQTCPNCYNTLVAPFSNGFRCSQCGFQFSDNSLVIHPRGMMVASVSLSSAQLLVLQESPVEIVPPQGGNTLIVPLFAVVFFYPVTTPYMNVQGSFFNFNYEGDSSKTSPIVVDASTILTETVDSFQASSATSNTVSSAIYGAGMEVTNNFLGGDWTTGDGRVEITLYYSVFER